MYFLYVLIHYVFFFLLVKYGTTQSSLIDFFYILCNLLSKSHLYFIVVCVTLISFVLFYLLKRSYLLVSYLDNTDIYIHRNI